DENDIVLDPFSGTGTTAISAKRLGRQYIGFELDEKYAEISQEKLKLVLPNYKIGKSWVSFYLRDIATIRNNDWTNLEQYFNVPNPARTIDYQKVELKTKKMIPNDIEFQGDIATMYIKNKAINTDKRELMATIPMVAMSK
ncbi:MAG: site-specific DNA-methyltransferase, partial [Prevotellaceae bacterium]|nr:site-specific DNA-methyltransferase [Prevotellaceae bacterium]